MLFNKQVRGISLSDRPNNPCAILGLSRCSKMGSESPLDDWNFMVGRWQGKSEGEFGEEGVIENSAVFTLELGGGFILGRHEARQGNKIINQSIGLLFYDVLEGKFRRKSFFSYGFVNNEIAYQSDGNEIRFTIESEPLPKQFEGMSWRSYLIKVSSTKILMGLEQAKQGEGFTSYGETSLTKVS